MYSEKEAMCFIHCLLGNRVTPRKNIIRYFGSATDCLQAPNNELISILGKDDASAIEEGILKSDISATYSKLTMAGIDYTFVGDANYPSNLLDIPGAPLALFYKGFLPDSCKPRLAIIGARNCSAYGRQLARECAREVAANNIQIISGMAYGVDSIAEQAAFDAGGVSFAVLGSGVDICYPKEQRSLYDKSVREGGVISEYIPGTPPNAHFFPARNRIISGLADAVLVIEARERSGTLLTVGAALDQGRDVYCVPGRINDSLSYGCNMLIREGAYIVTRPYELVEDFLKNCGYKQERSGNKKAAEATDNKSVFLTANERIVIGVLDYTPKSIGEIFLSLEDKSDMDLPQLMGLLTDMTIHKKIRCIDGSNYYLENIK